MSYLMKMERLTKPSRILQKYAIVRLGNAFQRRSLLSEIPKVDERGRHVVTMLPGLGIGPETMSYVEAIFTVAKAPIVFEKFNTATEPYDPHKERKILEQAVKSILKNKVALQGSLEHQGKINMEYDPANVYLRKELKLFANVIRIKSIPDIPAKFNNLDIVIIRQNTEGEYSMMEHTINHRIVQSLKVSTRRKSEELARYACLYARIHGRRKISIIHKANIQKLSDGLFLHSVRKICRDYEDIIEYEDMIIDNACMQMVSNPHQFDIIVAPNLYGGIITNLLCGLTGGPGLSGGTNLGIEAAIFEPASRNVGMTIIGKNKANPVAMLAAATDMLRHLLHLKESKAIQNAILKTICIDKIRTPDIGGTNTTSEVAKSICENLMFD